MRYRESTSTALEVTCRQGVRMRGGGCCCRRSADGFGTTVSVSDGDLPAVEHAGGRCSEEATGLAPVIVPLSRCCCIGS